MALRDSATRAAYVIMDEFHYYADRDRAMAWQVPLLALDATTFLLMSATLGDIAASSPKACSDDGREVAVVRGRQRPGPARIRSIARHPSTNRSTS
jgi:superfamily II RNA helicase